MNSELLARSISAVSAAIFFAAGIFVERSRPRHIPGMRTYSHVNSHEARAKVFLQVSGILRYCALACFGGIFFPGLLLFLMAVPGVMAVYYLASHAGKILGKKQG